MKHVAPKGARGWVIILLQTLYPYGVKNKQHIIEK